jgi:DNA ligase (NAD+)
MNFQEQIVKASSELLDQLPSLSIEQLELLVRHHNHAYFVDNKAEISDEAFDKLAETLRFLEPDSFILEEIETQKILKTAVGVVVHQQPMLSLDKCYEEDSFLKWREKVNGALIAMPKIDGVACSIRYDAKGQLHIAATRGDGKRGENITANVQRIQDVPHPLLKSLGAEIEIRGEVYMKLSRFASHYKEQFVNPRNLAAGALKQKEADKSAAYELSFFPYDIRGVALETEVEKFDLLNALGFQVPPTQLVDSDGECKRAFLHFATKRSDLNYEIDGVVFRANRVSEQGRLGITAHHPKWSIAYKFQGESAQTYLENVEWSVGRTGAITPVVIVKPVFVSGATVMRASLHNWGLFRKLHLSQGALVEIVRRGGVIPHLERVLRAGSEPMLAPNSCPSCQGSVIEEGDFLRCQNPLSCPTVIEAKIEHFCAVLGIDGFGKKIIQTLIKEKLVQHPTDLYRLKINDLLGLERVGEKLATKLLKEIAQKREIELIHLITALGIGEVGPTVAAIIVKHYPTMETLRQANVNEIASIYGIGVSIAESLVDGLKAEQKSIDDLLTEIKISRSSFSSDFDSSHPLFEKNVVFTGAMRHLERKEAQKKVRAVGGKTPAAVSNFTDYLVVGDDGSPLFGPGEMSSKQKSAQKLIEKNTPIQIISETELIKMLKL